MTACTAMDQSAGWAWQELTVRTSSVNSSRQARRRTVSSSSMTVTTPRLQTSEGKLARILSRNRNAVLRMLSELFVVCRRIVRTWI